MLRSKLSSFLTIYSLQLKPFLWLTNMVSQFPWDSFPCKRLHSMLIMASTSSKDLKQRHKLRIHLYQSLTRYLKTGWMCTYWPTVTNLLVFPAIDVYCRNVNTSIKTTLPSPLYDLFSWSLRVYRILHPILVCISQRIHTTLIERRCS